MNFHLLVRQILVIFNGERTIAAPYHLLKGKKSSQTLEDVALFHLHNFYRILPQLERAVYEQAILQLEQEGVLTISNDKSYRIEPMPLVSYHFNGWRYQGLEAIFFKRLQLTVQTLSQHQAQDMKFAPVVSDTTIQQFTRQFLQQATYQQGELSAKLYQEIVTTLKQTIMTEDQRMLISYRLSGYEQPAQTLRQLALATNHTVLDVQLLLIEALHIWLDTLDTPLLFALRQGCVSEQALTETAAKTNVLLEQGYTFEQICHYRHLKASTIQDHIVEIARNMASFDVTPYIDSATLQRVHQVVRQMQTKRLKVLHEQTGLPYFQIRLALTREG
ncbi:hypothetical protein CH76_01360 [Lysinibacillus sp. BF-4]|uniref:helix-turn-helix domain-containing protein n=1 Tax=Lysinibacillus sp. BF-4 TaxID=1473546 RepID=UPI000506E0AE|nr:helix-turn-helix domain-containing protein [Lysinibacillus sp. BF-4]KFL44484.1 hypothetical protein CH76_01360 [Lysinibacillus sp. BF-4]